MKYEWRKKDKSLYLPKAMPTIIDVPTMQYLTLEGEGNPNSDRFTTCVQSLYAMSYGLKMLPKTGVTVKGYFDYTVFPLEAVWNLTDEGISQYKAGVSIIELKDNFKYKIMIRQPEFMDAEVVEAVRAKVADKKKDLPINQVIFETISEGKAVQMMHIGIYDDEPATFAEMEAYAEAEGMKRKDKSHKEIYLSDPRKVAPEKLKTTLRFYVEA